MQENKILYQQFCQQEKNIPLFIQYNWMANLYPNDLWGVAIVTRGEQVVGAMPYVRSKKKGFSLIVPPFLTPYQGVYIKYPEQQKYVTKISYEKKIMEELITQLPKVDAFIQHFLPSFTNWLPFYWKGYQQTTRYTYIIDDISDNNQVFANFKENIRREIRKAEKTLTIIPFQDIKKMHQLKLDYHATRDDDYDVPLSTLEKIHTYCQKNNCGEILAATDQDKNIHSLLLYVWDNETAYYLNGVTNPAFKTSGSMSLLLWEAIKKSTKNVKAFNFEGSMIAPIERYFRAFGGTQTPYFKISKIDSKILKLLKF